ncbi:MAG: nucleotidyltransferase domain-containing protein [Acidimicrobiaceae bacterium]|nr:nucleotidyltransferase domain-containing protein [Acidimicrobiaceae bacterium]
MDFVHPVSAVIPGAQGHVLAVLAETSAELNLRTVARLAGVSASQASRVIPGLVELGLVERREVPPSSLFRLNRHNEAARIVVQLARLRDNVLERIGSAAGDLPQPPASIIVFGSFARREADRTSDIDVVVVRPDEVDPDDDAWTEGIDRWRRNAGAIAGNDIEVIEVGLTAAVEKLSHGGQVWDEISRDGVSVFGASLDRLRDLINA